MKESVIRGIELPSLEELEEIEKQRSLSLETLEISYSSNNNDSDKVKCQKCNFWVPIVGGLTRSQGNPIEVLERKIRCAEMGYPSAYTIHKEELKQELADLLQKKKRRRKISFVGFHYIATILQDISLSVQNALRRPTDHRKNNK